MSDVVGVLDNAVGFGPCKVGRFLNVVFGLPTRKVGVVVDATGELLWSTWCILHYHIAIAVPLIAMSALSALGMVHHATELEAMEDRSDDVLPKAYIEVVKLRRRRSVLVLLAVALCWMFGDKLMLVGSFALNAAGSHILSMCWPKRRNWFSVKAEQFRTRRALQPISVPS